MGAELSHLKQTKPDHVILSQAMEEMADVESMNHEKALTKSHGNSTHFSDYSMFPDRFNEKSIKSIQGIAPPIEIHTSHHLEQDMRSHFSDFSLFPDKFDCTKLKRSVSAAPQDLKSNENQPYGSLPASGLISKYSYRLRSSSVNESDIKLGSSDIIDQQNLSPPDHQRPRSLSNSKMYNFDFSPIPEKDPKVNFEERKNQTIATEIKQEALKVPLPIPEEKVSLGPFSVPTSSSMNDFAQKNKRVRKTSAHFSDYSMFPDRFNEYNKKK